MTDDGAIMDAEFQALLQDIDRNDSSVATALTDSSEAAAVSADFLDFFVNDATADGGSAGESTAPPSTTSLNHALRCRNNRKRKKMEVDELRATATALEETLIRLTHRQPPETPATPPSFWRAVSKDTMVDCQQAILRNKKLRELVQQHALAARNIQQALTTIPDVTSQQHLLEQEASIISEPRKRRLRSSSRSPDLYHELFQSIHSVYEQNDHADEMAFLKIGMRKISMEMVTHQQNDQVDMCIQVRECQKLPFSLSWVSEATWKHLSSPCLPSDSMDSMSGQCERTTLQSRGDDLFGDCGSECKPLPLAEDDLPGRLAIRRFVEKNRLTFVWVCDGCFHCDDAKKPIGRVTERGWCTIEPSDGSPDCATTVFRIQVQYMPKTRQEKMTTQPRGTTTTVPCCPNMNRGNMSTDVALDLYRRTVRRTFGAVEDEVFKDVNCSAQV